MNIGILGTGAIGSILARKLSKAGHSVKVTNTREMQELRKIAEDLGAEAASTQDVVKDVDVVIFSMPFSAYKNLPKDLLKNVPKDVVIIDTSNYYPMRDGDIPELNDKTESDYISSVLGRPLIKLFNNIMEYTFKNKGKASGEKDRIAIAVAGDNPEHKKTASQLADITGFDTVDTGNLSDSWRQQPGTPAYCTELNAAELKKALDIAVWEKASEVRDKIMNKRQNFDLQQDHDKIVALNRSMSYESVGQEYKA